MSVDTFKVRYDFNKYSDDTIVNQNTRTCCIYLYIHINCEHLETSYFISRDNDPLKSSHIPLFIGY